MDKKLIIRTRASADRVFKVLSKNRITSRPVITLSAGFTEAEELTAKLTGLSDSAMKRYKELVGK